MFSISLKQNIEVMKYVKVFKLGLGIEVRDLELHL